MLSVVYGFWPSLATSLGGRYVLVALDVLVCGRGERACVRNLGPKRVQGPPPSPPAPLSAQEPGSDAEIKEFAAGYNVKFDMFSKICVNGDDAHPLWKWMKVQPKGRGMLGK